MNGNGGPWPSSGGGMPMGGTPMRGMPGGGIPGANMPIGGIIGSPIGGIICPIGPIIGGMPIMGPIGPGGIGITSPCEYLQRSPRRQLFLLKSPHISRPVLS